MVYNPVLPFDISCISSGKSKRYMLFDVELITWLRREHHILGVLVGTLPQAPSQNVFLGLPLELMPEEVRLLVEKRLARVVDDSVWFSKAARRGVTGTKFSTYRDEIVDAGMEAAEASRRAKQFRIAEGLRMMRLNQRMAVAKAQSAAFHEGADPKADDLFNDNDNDNDNDTVIEPSIILTGPLSIIRACAGALAQDGLHPGATPAESSSYLLFKTLHDQGYSMSPGLRFGCQFMAYPGDPLRYHSHFLAIAVDSDKSIPLIDIIGGGRLATAVKKSFLLGSVKAKDSISDTPRVKTYSIEWAGI